MQPRDGKVYSTKNERVYSTKDKVYYGSVQVEIPPYSTRIFKAIEEAKKSVIHPKM
jgi:hypothetical protein